MTKQAKKICRSQHDWHINASRNWDENKFWNATKNWCITKTPNYQHWLNKRNNNY